MCAPPSRARQTPLVGHRVPGDRVVVGGDDEEPHTLARRRRRPGPRRPPRRPGCPPAACRCDRASGPPETWNRDGRHLARDAVALAERQPRPVLAPTAACKNAPCSALRGSSGPHLQVVRVGLDQDRSAAERAAASRASSTPRRCRTRSPPASAAAPLEDPVEHPFLLRLVMTPERADDLGHPPAVVAVRQYSRSVVHDRNADAALDSHHAGVRHLRQTDPRHDKTPSTRCVATPHPRMPRDHPQPAAAAATRRPLPACVYAT